MMKKIVLTLFLLSLVVSANAGLTIVIQGEGGFWFAYPESKYTITPSTEIVVGVVGDAAPGTFVWGISGGPGSLSENVVTYQDGVTASMTDDADMAASLGVQNMFITMTVIEPLAGSALLASDIFHCDGPGDVTLVLIDNEQGLILDSQVIHQIPEPATLALLGIGSVLLRRRRRV